jgi:hypothetical protein
MSSGRLSHESHLFQMAENIRGMMVTEEMLISAARAGDLESLMMWARQGVRVASAEPLVAAAHGGHLEAMRCLVRELGADVNQATRSGSTPLVFAARRNDLALVHFLVEELGADANQAVWNDGRTPLNVAASRGNLAVVRSLVHLGAEVGAVDFDGDTALLMSALFGEYATMKYLLEDAGANMDDVNNRGKNVWHLLTEQLTAVAEGETEVDFEALIALLRVLVLRDAPPPSLVTLLPPESARVVQEGARLRARLPAYLVQRRALLDAHCPVLLPPLRTLVRGYMELTTTEELWATGLGKAP